MTKRCWLSLAAVVTVLAFALGCGSSSNSGGGPGLTEAELKKMMEQVANDSPTRLPETTAEETMELFTDPMGAQMAKSGVAGVKRLMLGTILEVSPAEGEAHFLVLDGGTHNGKAYKVKCIFGTDQREALTKLKAGDQVHVEGTSDGVVNDVTLEFKDCILSSDADEATTPKASDATKENGPKTKP